MDNRKATFMQGMYVLQTLAMKCSFTNFEKLEVLLHKKRSL